MLSEIELQELKKISMRQWDLIMRLNPDNALECGTCGFHLMMADADTGELSCPICDTAFDGKVNIEDEE